MPCFPFPRIHTLTLISHLLYPPPPHFFSLFLHFSSLFLPLLANPHFQTPHCHTLLIVGSFLKSATWLPLPWPCKQPSLRHVASLIPPGGRGGILYGRRSTFSGYFTAGACHRMEEKYDSTSPVRHVRIRWRRLPGVHPRPTIQITWTTWLVRHSRFAGSIFAYNQEANSDNTIDQVSWTITHLQYKIRLTRHSQIFSDCLTHSRYRKS